MSWLEKILPPRINTTETKKSMPEGLWIKCPSCEEVLYNADLEVNQHVCPKCDHHLRIGARARLDKLLDEDGRIEIGQEVKVQFGYDVDGQGNIEWLPEQTTYLSKWSANSIAHHNNDALS